MKLVCGTSDEFSLVGYGPPEVVPRYTLYPETCPLSLHVSATLGGNVPVPVKVCTVGELSALLTKETLPEAAPAEVGAKVTVKGTLCPGFTVTGKLIPLTE